MIRAEDAADDLYHVTYLFNLDGIVNSGLEPGQGQVFGGGFEGHSRGRVFLADWTGVDFWVQRYGELAEHHTDNPEQGWVPIVLHIDAEGLDLGLDEPGTDDSGGGSFFTRGAVGRNRILAVWDGEAWVGLDDVDTTAMLDRALAAADVEEDDDGTLLYYMDYDVFLPDEDS